MEQPSYLSVLTFRTQPGKRPELLDLYEELEILRRALRQPGAIDMAMTEALDDPEGVLITSTWDDPRSYRAWLDHPERGELTGAIAPLLAGDPHAATYRVVDAVAAGE